MCPSSLDICKLTNLLIKASRGKYGRDKAIALKNLAANSIGTCNRSLSFELKQTIRLIKSVQAEIVVLDKQIKLVVELDSPLITIPGISYTLAAIILAEIGDINRFSSPAKLLAFAGLEPSTYQSGNFTASNTPMVKRGATYLRRAIMTSARLVSMRDTTFHDYLSKKRSEGKHYYVALSHVSRKLLCVIHHLLLSGTAFVPQL